MKRVAILSNSALGLYSFRRELIERLVQEGNEVVIFAPDEEKKDYFKNMGCQYKEISIERRGINPLSDVKLLMAYYREIRNTKPDVVLTYTIKPNIYGGLVCSLLGVPYISNITGLGSALENRGWLRLLTMFLYKLSLRKARCVFFQNKENQRFFLENIFSDVHNRLIPGSGVNLDHYQVLEYPHGDEIHFLFIGRILKEKGIDLYLEAAEHLKSKYSNTFFHVLGACDEKYCAILKDKESKGIIHYHGRQNDVREFHKISHCTIHPSYYPEGMSNVLLESAACGRPVITTNRNGCREVVDDGVNGYLVQPRDAKDLIEKIERFLQLGFEEKRKMGLMGRVKVEQQFDRNIVIQSYMEEINAIFN